ncbi:FAD linked oxidase-like protein [Rubrobacter xylanophilus DSM 9941]|uniref:FAD linked oxidase-like protein n=1 Tax=Rubrobacter xylanophilus (strain DSM 9941 / JCM 11954 / NBRC 16129 / PRD-1) TaxID=266117 RepID=Q1AS84_RUBXD|nr:FAD-binding oxidoreductase [Rubrobacter xylanophilus]ABG05744.1 FAD linked oxidase-like protein [Rubrobacter xylanophilus DSM 9941]
MKTGRIPAQEELRRIAGAEHVREAAPEDAVDGVRPSLVVEPGSVEEVGAVMRVAHREGLAVVVRGGGTKLGWGNPPAAADLILSTARLDGVLEHAAGDLVLRVQAGVRLDELQERLAGAGQMLAIDPPQRGATVGGVIAANAYGPRRYRYGTIRDLIIGIKVVLADGTVAKAGGKVVKNVAGYDLSKLFTGSLGTLGVIVEANFRLHPVPKAARTVAVEPESPRAARDAAQAIMHSQVEATAVELHWGGDGERLLSVLVESIPEGVEAKREAAAFLLRPFGEVRDLGEGEAAELGPVPVPGGSGGEVVARISAPPAELGDVLESLLRAAERRGVGVRVRGHAATGITYAGLRGGEEEIASLVGELREIRARRGGSVVLLGAPPGLERRVDAWGPGGDYLALARRVKEKFDPRGILSPGRFIGGI